METESDYGADVSTSHGICGGESSSPDSPRIEKGEKPTSRKGNGNRVKDEGVQLRRAVSAQWVLVKDPIRSGKRASERRPG